MNGVSNDASTVYETVIQTPLSGGVTSGSISNLATVGGDLYLTLIDMDPSNTYEIVIRDNEFDAQRVELTETSGVSGALTIVDPGILLNTDVITRLYEMVETAPGGSPVTHPAVWAMQKQARRANGWHMIGIPIDFDTPTEFNLNSTLGQQLGSGLVGGGNEMTSPNIYFLDTSVTPPAWSNFYFDSSSTWYVPPDSPADYVVNPAAGAWIKTQPTDPGGQNTVFAGRTHETNDPPPITMLSNSWNLFAWPFPEPRFEAEGVTGRQGWEFLFQGARGGAGWNSADRMFMESDGQTYNLYLDTGGRWRIQNTETLPAVSLRFGRGYYYFVTGTSFIWRAQWVP